MNLQPNFDISKGLGKWYQIYRVWNPIETGSDISVNYSANSDGSVRLRQREWNQDSRTWTERSGRAYSPDQTKPAEMEVKLDVWFLPARTYKVLKTDYSNYSVLYVNDFFGKHAWIYGRDPELSKAATDEVFKVVETETSLKREDFI